MNGEPLSPVTDADIAAYDRDGVVCLRRMFDAAWVQRLRGAIQRDIETPGPMAINFAGDGSDGTFFGDMFMWTRDADFRAAVFDSPAPAIAARMMRTDAADFFYDQLFVKEPGTAHPTPWHQDQPYWAVSGWQIATVWIALDHVDRSNARSSSSPARTTAARGSGHRLHQGRRERCAFRDSALPAIPDIEAERIRHDIRWWEMEAGDCLVFHAMIVHGAPGNLTPGARRRGLALRYTGDDARYDPRPGTFKMLREPELAAGAPMTCDLFPRVWPRASA